MAIDRCCGFECGIKVTGGTPPAGHLRHWNALTVGANLSISTTIFRPGSIGLASMRFAPAANVADIGNSFVVGVDTQYVWRGAFYVDTMPDVACKILRMTTTLGATAVVWIDPATTQIYGQFTSSGTATTKYTIATGRWYLVDVGIRVDQNPRLISMQVTDDAGVTTDLGTGSFGTGTSVMTAWRLGLSLSGDTATGVAHWDDCAWSYNIADYPLGNGYVVPISPGADGTHNAGAAGDFKINSSTNITGSETNLYTNVDDPDLAVSAADFLTQNVAVNTEYLEMLPGTLGSGSYPTGATVRNMTLIARLQNVAGTTANDVSFKMLSGANTDAAVNAVSLASAAAIYFSKGYATDLDGTTALTWAILQALKFRFGFSGNVASIPALHGFMLEVEYVPAAAGPAISPQGRMPLIALL